VWGKEVETTFFTEQFDSLVAGDDKFRLIKENVDFGFVNELARPYYGHLGATGYRPDKLYKCLLVMYLEGIRSERVLEERLRFDIRYRYFCDLDIADPIPDHSTFSVFKTRLGEEIFGKIFDSLVEQVLALGVEKPSHFSVDSTSVLADCTVPRKDRGQPADRDASFGRRVGGTQVFFGYKGHNLIDSKSGVVLGTEATTGSAPDIPSARRLLEKVGARHKITPEHLAADKAYGSIGFREELKEKDIVPVIPQRKGGKVGGFPKEMFTFNSDGDLVCPVGRKMVTHTKRSHKERELIEYAGKECGKCELRDQCTTAKRRRLTLSVHESQRRIHEQFQLTEEFRVLYARRNSVERVFASLKRWHGLNRAKFRCLWKVDFQLKMAATANNLQKLVGILIKAPPTVV
jgi:transposase